MTGPGPGGRETHARWALTVGSPDGRLSIGYPLKAGYTMRWVPVKSVSQKKTARPPGEPSSHSTGRGNQQEGFRPRQASGCGAPGPSSPPRASRASLPRPRTPFIRRARGDVKRKPPAGTGGSQLSALDGEICGRVSPSALAPSGAGSDADPSTTSVHRLEVRGGCAFNAALAAASTRVTFAHRDQVF